MFKVQNQIIMNFSLVPLRMLDWTMGYGNGDKISNAEKGGTRREL